MTAEEAAEGGLNTMREMKSKVALVTGSASGIGRVTAQAFAGEGAKVIVTTDANVQGAEETVRLIKDAGGEATFIKCDVSREKEVESLIAKSVEMYGSLDYAFNNAGVGPDGKRIGVFPIADHREHVVRGRTEADPGVRTIWREQVG